MPTPFMHMALARRLIEDPALPEAAHKLLSENWGAFLLGSIAPDARVSSGVDRAATHFFEYTPVIDPPPAKAMLMQHPGLVRSALDNDEQVAFVAGYAGHLSMDEVWSTELLFPRFLHGEPWAPQQTRFLVLHLLLANLDQRDRALLPDTYYERLAVATPRSWIPFMTDEGLLIWRDTVASQLAPGADSRTNEILGQRVGLTPQQMSEKLADQAEMDRLTWANISKELLAQVEEKMYTAVYTTVDRYLKGTL